MIAGEIGLKLPAMWKGLSLAALVSSLGPPVIAQEAGWHYSPYSGEGDRAALGCAYASTRTDYTCVAVRCEDDMSVGLYVHTGRLGGDAGRWLLQIDDARHEITAEAVDGSPYGARVTGDIEGLLFEIKNGGAVFLDPLAQRLTLCHQPGALLLRATSERNGAGDLIARRA